MTVPENKKERLWSFAALPAFFGAFTVLSFLTVLFVGDHVMGLIDIIQVNGGLMLAHVTLISLMSQNPLFAGMVQGGAWQAIAFELLVHIVFAVMALLPGLAFYLGAKFPRKSAEKSKAIKAAQIIALCLAVLGFMYFTNWQKLRLPVRFDEETVASLSSAETVFERKASVERYLNGAPGDEKTEREYYSAYPVGDDIERVISKDYKPAFSNTWDCFEDEDKETYYIEYVDSNNRGIINGKIAEVGISKKNAAHAPKLGEENYIDYEIPPEYPRLTRSGDIGSVHYEARPWQRYGYFIVGSSCTQMTFETENAVIYVKAYNPVFSPENLFGRSDKLDAVLADVANIVNAGL